MTGFLVTKDINIKSQAHMRRDLFSKVADGLRRRQTGDFAGHTLESFGRDVLGHKHTPDQLKILRALEVHPRVCVRSGHGCGKTRIAGEVGTSFLNVHKDSHVVTTAPTGKSLKHRLWAEIGRIHMQSKVRLPGELLTLLYRLGPKWEMLGISTDDANNFQGGHAENLLIIFDEAQGVRPTIWTAAESMMNNPGARWLVIGNPIEASGPYYHCFSDPTWHEIHMDCEQHPNVLAEARGEAPPFPEAVQASWVEDRKRAWGEDSPLYLSRVRGIFPDVADESLIPGSLLRIAADLEVLKPHYLLVGRHMGVDVARMGSDRCAAGLLVDGDLIKSDVWGSWDLMASCGRIIDLMRRWNVEALNIHVDTCGLGAGIVDRLREQGHWVDAVDFGSRVLGDWEDITGEVACLNRRAELYWALRTLLQHGYMKISLEEVWPDVSSMNYDYDSTGKVRIEPKLAVRRRLGRSPDLADMAALALSRDAALAGISWV